jgi:hypothetical protein
MHRTKPEITTLVYLIDSPASERSRVESSSIDRLASLDKTRYEELKRTLIMRSAG